MKRACAFAGRQAITAALRSVPAVTTGQWLHTECQHPHRAHACGSTRPRPCTLGARRWYNPGRKGEGDDDVFAFDLVAETDLNAKGEWCFQTIRDTLDAEPLDLELAEMEWHELRFRLPAHWMMATRATEEEGVDEMVLYPADSTVQCSVAVSRIPVMDAYLPQGFNPGKEFAESVVAGAGQLTHYREGCYILDYADCRGVTNSFLHVRQRVMYTIDFSFHKHEITDAHDLDVECGMRAAVEVEVLGTTRASSQP